MIERRQHSRRRTFLAGRIEIAKLNGWELQCAVRNLSETGARLAIPGDVVVPRNVDLAISNGPLRPAQLIWYREGQAGFALGERRTTPRPMAANDTAPARTRPGTTRLSTRIAAIAAKDRAGRSHFTGI